MASTQIEKGIIIMLKDDGTCDLKCEGCEYENDKRCLDILFYTTNAKVAVIETREPGDTISQKGRFFEQ